MGRFATRHTDLCAICTLTKPPLFDASHITPDVDERGLPVVANGLSLCKIHHAAYDQINLGISPDYTLRATLRSSQKWTAPGSHTASMR